MKLLIKNGHLIDPAKSQNSGMDLLIEDGKVAVDSYFFMKNKINNYAFCEQTKRTKFVVFCIH